jgi:crossover junction endodeoxyribonuclease RuvC
MKILGIDPALSVTGYGLIESKNNRLSLLTSGVIITSTKKDYSFRLNQIYSQILNIIKQFNPQVMVIEKMYIHFRHPTTAYILGQVKGVVSLLSAQTEVPLYEYAPTRIKKSLLGVGQASKYQIQRMVMELLGMKSMPSHTDITDALAVAIAHSYISKSKFVISKIK